jgi:hypothetical protein
MAYADEYSKTDIALQSTYTMLHIIDWGQTLDISKNSDKYWEINPILGKHPSVSKVNIYMGTSLAIYYIVNYFLPSDYRLLVESSSVILKASLVSHNYKIGLYINF